MFEIRSPLVVLFLSLITLTSLPEFSIRPVSAIIEPGPTFSPFGPRTGNLVMSIYGDSADMFNAFQNGQIDLPDWSVLSPADEASFANNPDFYLSDGQSDLGIFQLDINHHSTFLGIPMQENRSSDNFNSPSTKQPTAAGIEIRRAIAHLLDKPSFIQGVWRAQYTDIQAPPLQGLNLGGAGGMWWLLSAAVLAEDCSAHPWFTPCDNTHPPVSAYNLVADALADPLNSFADLGYPGIADLRAACDHLVMAGFPISPSGSDCLTVAQGNAKLVPVGQANFYIRTHQPRKAFGTIIRDALNFLFGSCTILHGTSCVDTYFTITMVVDIIFQTEPNRDDWHLYTGGWSLGSTADHLYELYHSQFASSVCGGKRSTFAANYHFYCSPEFDQEASAGQFAQTLAEANVRFTNAAVIAHREVMTVPVFSAEGIKYVALNGWSFLPGPGSSLVPVLGHDWSAGFGFWSFLNMRQRPGYVPSDQRYVPGGGDPNLIRRGMSQPVINLSPFHAATFWDFEVLGSIYDSMLATNPFTGGIGLQLIDWMTVSHTQIYEPNEIFAGFTGITTQTWVLRNDLKWHDGIPLTAEDVAFTFLKYRDIPPSRILPSPTSILDAVALNSRTVQVKLTGQSPFFERNIGTLPILPKHIWETIGDTTIGSPSFDPMAGGKMVGSGPWICRSLTTGALGGPCTTTGVQAISSGQIVLTAYDGYHRGRPGVVDSSLHKFSWADRNNDAKVDILDIADVAFRFGGPDPYWNTGQNLLAPQTVGSDAGRVDIVEVATVAFYFNHGLVMPFSRATATNLDPPIDPFF